MGDLESRVLSRNIGDLCRLDLADGLGGFRVCEYDWC